MKIRSNYISNSSSSSFIVAGNNIMEILEKNLTNNEIVKNDRYECAIGSIMQEMIYQCKQSNEEKVKYIISDLIYESAHSYLLYCFYKTSNSRCVCFDWNDVPESRYYEEYNQNSLFDITDEIKLIIKKKVKEIYDKTKSQNEFDYYSSLDNDKIQNLSNELTEKVYNKIISENKEVYAMSFGDNHGACSGEIGWMVEDYFLGEKAMNDYLESNFIIYQDNCH